MSEQESSQQDELSDALRPLLALLYHDDLAGPLALRLSRIARALRANTSSRSDTNRPLLITYGDTIRDDGEAPLVTLRRFLKRHIGASMGAVHVLPFYPSSSDDGFAVIDYRMVDHHLGGWEDVRGLAEDYELMFDLVINHCSRESLWFADFISGRDPGRHFFITLTEGSDTSAVIRPRSTPLISTVHTYAGIRHVWNTFSDDQIDLDFSNPEVLATFIDILFFYIEQGARLIRLDAIAFLWKRLGTSCMSLPETHVVVKILRLLVDRAAPGVRLITETNVPHAENVSYFSSGDEAHLVYQFSLAPLLLYSYVFGDASYLTTWAARLTPPPPGSSYLNFMASHDGIGLRPLEGLIPDENVERLVERMHERGAFATLRDAGNGEQRPYEINVTLFSAFGEALPPYLAAHTLLLSFQGLPALYIHSLLASLNDLELVEQTGRTRSINRGHWRLDHLEAALRDPESAQAQVLAHCREIIACREAQPALAETAEQHVSPSPPGVFLLRRECPEQQLVVVASVRPEAQDLPIAGSGLPQGTFSDCLSGRPVTVGDSLSLAPYEVLWLDVTQAKATFEPGIA
ncbi:MAG: alpha-amylase family glycosyl hydrolase [Pseudomonadota bacterium]